MIFVFFFLFFFHFSRFSRFSSFGVFRVFAFFHVFSRFSRFRGFRVFTETRKTFPQLLDGYRGTEKGLETVMLLGVMQGYHGVPCLLRSTSKMKPEVCKE